MSKYRVKKADGWNKYKIQKRFMLVFWLNVKGAVFIGKAKATIAWANLNLIDRRGK